MCTMDVKLLQLMEEFILKEVDYSQKYGYSGRAKRYMRRKLTDEISSFLENIESDSESESDSETESDSNENVNDNTPHDTSYENTFNKMIHCDYKTIHNRIDLCFLMTYLMFLGSIYASTAYIIYAYTHMQIQIPLPLQYSNQSEEFSKSCL